MKGGYENFDTTETEQAADGDAPDGHVANRDDAARDAYSLALGVAAGRDMHEGYPEDRPSRTVLEVASHARLLFPPMTRRAWLLKRP